MPKKYRRRPKQVDALKTYVGQPMTDIRDFLLGSNLFVSPTEHGSVFTELIQGVIEITPGDYILRGDTGAVKVCGVDEFEDDYERVADPDEIFMVVRTYGFTVGQAEFMLINDETRNILLENISGSLEGVLSEECIEKNVYSK